MQQRQVVLDTETTGLDAKAGHRIIEIGAVEVINRRITGRNFHHYLQPERQIDPQAIEVHGITNEFLLGKPHFPEIRDEFLQFITGAELIIHNASFDVGFLNAELKRCDDFVPVEQICEVLDTLMLARERHPGQRNSLDALCKRYRIDNSRRELHGALLDSEILADVYLAMTGGQTALSLSVESDSSNDDNVETSDTNVTKLSMVSAERMPQRVIMASESEQTLHNNYLKQLEKTGEDGCIWTRIPDVTAS